MDGLWRWELLSDNSRVVATCRHGYRQKVNCINSTKRLSSTAEGALIWNEVDEIWEVDADACGACNYSTKYGR